VTSYFIRCDISESDFKEPEVEFHKSPITSSDWRRSIHLRSAYRNDSIDRLNRELNQTPPIAEEHRFYMLSENDRAVALNYRRILDKWIEIGTSPKRRGENIGEIQDEILGELRNSMAELFKDTQFILAGLGSPNTHKVFEFDKGTNHGLSYENLSSGEKAALDMLLDIVVFKEEFNDTVFCIDEPEAHIHTKLQGPLLGELYKLIPDNSQLWIATHSIGMVRKAQDLWQKSKDAVVFLDFGKDDFDKPVKLKPTHPDSDFWGRVYEVALGDLAELVLTERTAFCEGRGVDSECYQNIFKSRYPNLRFVPLEDKGNVIKTVKASNLALGKIAKSAMVIGIIDLDGETSEGVKRRREEGIRTLSRRTIESFLLDDEVLAKVCEDFSQPDKVNDLLTAKQGALSKHNLKPDDNLKAIVQTVHGAAQKALKSVRLGDSKESFMMDILAPRIQPGMAVYEQLHEDIFG
ncbi:AAA family ATPase, partial [Candidatus Poribacteria bacterium]|nr:AAA family ATPase [Candidatus Poribacteria bacterium]